ncbi:MAG TPA: alkaline phosphatase family protein [Thermoanaerobaculia bacterium]|nr:alkaline phosphatase family protein [Thermoanaerobaculia bacterium]
MTRRLTRQELDRRDFLRLLAGGAASAGLGGFTTGCAGRGTDKRVVVLGLDGMDPQLIQALIDTGRAPSFKKLQEMGSFLPLQTTMPALSPVAWSSFITGTTPGSHGIADFIMRDPETYLPVFSIYRQLPPGRMLRMGGYELPLSGGGVENNRIGRPFWSYLTERDIPSIVYKIPTNFPLDETATRAVSGMGTPDLTDTYGLFNYFTSDPFEDYPGVSGGTVTYVEVIDDRVRTELVGPINTFLVSSQSYDPDPNAHKAMLPFEVHLDDREDAALIVIGDQKVVLHKGEFSEWVPVEFELLPVIGTVRGICRFLLKDVRPHLRLYVTPINIDPAEPALPVTYPEELGGELARAIGPFWTKGLPSDTKAFDYRILNDEEYVKQAQLIFGERMALFDYEWARFDKGLFYFYVSSTDQDAHMMWRNMDETHPMHAASDVRFAGYLMDLYAETDKMVGKILPAIDDDTLVLVCSDHGFAPFGREFHLNTWLRERGYLKVKDTARAKDITSILDVDWSETVAYGMGFNGLFLNLKGREAQGIVEERQVALLLRRLTQELEALRDDETGKSPVARVYGREELYSGDKTHEMAELFVGYTPGFRSSASSVIGETGPGSRILGINPWAWSGDHSMARDLVPGTLFSSRRAARNDPSILDLPVTILEWFGVAKPSQMVGRSIFQA